MAFDQHKNLAYSLVATAPSPATSGTSLVVTAADGTKFPAVPFNATVWATGSNPTTANAEIVRVTAISTDTFTIVRAQESTSARTIVVGDQIAATITNKTLTDIEANVFMCASAQFEVSGHYNQDAGGTGTNTFGQNRLIQETGATNPSYARTQWAMFRTSGADARAGSPTWSTHIVFNVNADSRTTGQSFFGLGQPTVAGAGITFTNDHAGFKILNTAGPTYTLFATQANGTTETASSALTTLATQDELDLILHFNGTTSVDYYWRLNGGALSAPTNLATNLPRATQMNGAYFAISSQGASADFANEIYSSSYSRS